MRKLSNTERQDLEQHKLWISTKRKEGKRLDWSFCDLSEANLRGAYLQGADLRGAYLQGADLQGADLQGAYLQGVDLRGAYLRGAYLQGVDLKGAYLQGADLQGADLRGAYLQGADLKGVDLRGAYLRGVNLQGVKGYIGFVNVGSEGRALHCNMWADGWHCYTGCFSGTLAEFESAVEEKHSNDKYGVQYKAIIRLLREIEPMYREEAQ